MSTDGLTKSLNVPEKMKAWVLGDPDELKLVDKPVPQPGPAEVLVRVDAIAVCATDLEIISHGPPALIQGGAPFAVHVKAGTLRVLVALAAKRDPSFPEVPTAREQGISVGAELWRGIAVPKGTPKAVIAKLEDAIHKTVVHPDFIKASERLSVTPAFLPAAEFGKVIAKEDAEIAHIMQTLGLKKSPN